LAHIHPRDEKGAAEEPGACVEIRSGTHAMQQRIAVYGGPHAVQDQTGSWESVSFLQSHGRTAGLDVQATPVLVKSTATLERLQQLA
jgi:hypothetical protein